MSNEHNLWTNHNVVSTRCRGKSRLFLEGLAITGERIGVLSVSDK